MQRVAHVLRLQQRQVQQLIARRRCELPSCSTVSCGMRLPDWLEMVTPAPPGAITLPTSSSSTAVPYRSTCNSSRSTPATATRPPRSPNSRCRQTLPLRNEFPESMRGLPRSACIHSQSNPASVMILAMASAFSGRLSATTILRPYPIRRAIAMPIWPAPIHSTTLLLIRSTFQLLTSLAPTRAIAAVLRREKQRAWAPAPRSGANFPKALSQNTHQPCSTNTPLCQSFASLCFNPKRQPKLSSAVAFPRSNKYALHS